MRERTEEALERPLRAGAAKGEADRTGVFALAVSATNAARSADSTRRLGLAGNCESCSPKHQHQPLMTL